MDNQNEGSPATQKSERALSRSQLWIGVFILLVMIVFSSLLVMKSGVGQSVTPKSSVPTEISILPTAAYSASETPLAITQVFPADQSRDIEGNSVITVIFNTPIVPLTSIQEQSKLTDPLIITPTVEGDGEWLNTSVYVFRTRNGLKSGQKYEVTVPAGLKDVSGTKELEEDFHWVFATREPKVGSLRLKSGKIDPPNGLTNVILDEVFYLDFLQPMETTSTEQALTLTADDTSRVPLNVEWNDTKTTLTITPTQRLKVDASYQLHLGEEAQTSDGSSLVNGVDWKFTTLPMPKIVSVQPSDQSEQQYYSPEFLIQFSSPMRIDTIKDKIVIRPAPAEEVEWWYNEWEYSLHGYFLKPSTEYTIEILPGMEDIYGNKVSEGKTVQFKTAALYPEASLRMPYGTALFRSVPEAQSFYVSMVNIKGMSVKLYRLDVDEFTKINSGEISQWNYLPPQDQLIWEKFIKNTAEKNTQQLEKVSLTDAERPSLAPGFYMIGVDADEIVRDETYPFLDTRLFVVANANLTLKTTPTEALVWITDLETGKPIGGVPVRLQGYQQLKLGTGITDENGIARIQYPDTYYGNSVFAFTTEGDVFSFAANFWGSGSYEYDSALWGAYYAIPGQWRAYVYTERPIYRPGQPVYFKAVVREDDDLSYGLPVVKNARVVIQSFDKVVWEEQLTISEFGTIAGKFYLSEDAALGEYQIFVYLPGFEEAIGFVNFNVAEYRRPEFKVETSLDRIEVLPGSSVTAKVTAEYYSGGKVANGKAHWTLTAAPYLFSPGDPYTEYSFSDDEMDRMTEGFPQGDGLEIVGEGDIQLSNDGSAQVDIIAQLGKDNQSRQMIFEADVTDVGQNIVSGRTEFILHKSEYYAGIKPLTYIGKAGKGEKFSAVLLDWNGKPVINYPLKVEISERRWHSVQQQQPDGSIVWSSDVENIPIAVFDNILSNEEGKAEIEFVPPNGGVYRARVCVLDSAERENCASTYMWVAGGEFIPWQQTNDLSFRLVTDKKNYQPGEMAEILIASPFEPPAYALLTVERGHIRQHEVIKLDSNSLVYTLPITADMAPNIYISCVIVKGVDENTTKPSFRVGLAELRVSPDETKLTMELNAEPAQASPGEEVTFTVLVKDNQGNPVESEVSLGLSDLATLSLVSPNSEPIHSYFYNRRSLGVQTSSPLIFSMDDFNALMEESLVAGAKMGSGGGKGGGELGVVEVRQEFPDTAYWNAFLVTGSDGKAIVKVKLPDNLTTWRLDARAVTKTTLAGQASLDLISSKPLFINPKTPRFFVSGDIAEIGAVVVNNTENDLLVQVKIQADGVTLFNESQKEITLLHQQQIYVPWKVKVNPEAERVDIIFSARSGEYQDATKPTLATLPQQGLAVYQYVSTETVATAGSIKDRGKREENILIPDIPEGSDGSLTLKLEPSLAAGMYDGLTYLEHYPYECIEQTISRFLPNVFVGKALRLKGYSDPEMEKKVAELVQTGLQKIYSHQNPDGGWGWWNRNRSDVQTSAYVVLGLYEAREAGYPVNSEVLESGIRFLKSSLMSPHALRNGYEFNQQAFVLYVLSKAERVDAADSGALFESREKLSIYGRAFLAYALYTANNDDTRVSTLLSDIENRAITSATGTSWQEKEQDYYSWNTDTRTTAIVLTVLEDLQANSPVNENIVRWLMNSREEGHWKGTQETAWSLMALAGWLERSDELEGRYRYMLAMNNRRLGSWDVDKENINKVVELRIAISELLRDEGNKLVLTKDDPSGTLYYTMHLSYPVPVWEIQPLARGVVVDRQYFLEKNPRANISEAHQGDIVYGRLTVIVPNDVHYLVVEDPLPAGLEAIDQTLLTSTQSEQPQQFVWEDLLYKGWGWWYFDHVEYRDEKVVLAAEYLPAGTYVFTYIARASTVGEFQTRPASAYEFYFPEVFGRGAGMTFTVLP
jgi:uncharacterized protein YfaS (alpha-2-macroglobulin family)